MDLLIRLLHLLAAIVWLGGMVFMLLALRPAAIATLEPQPRARLMGAVWQRFFRLVWAAIAVLLLSGGHLYAAAARGAAVPLGWQLMAGAGLLMTAIFGHLYFAPYRRFQRALQGAEWPVAAQAAALIQKLVWTNLGLGLAAVLALRLLG